MPVTTIGTTDVHVDAEGFLTDTKERMHDLRFTMLGNTATHMPQGLGGLPGMTALATHQMKKQIADIGVPRSLSSCSKSSTRAVTCGPAACRPT